MPDEKQFLISESVLQGIATYLAARPYREVVNIIAALQSVEEFRNLDPAVQPKPKLAPVP
jgi:hypothetical protein